VYVRLWNKPFLFYLKTVGGGFVAASGPVRLGKTIDMHGRSVASPFSHQAKTAPWMGHTTSRSIKVAEVHFRCRLPMVHLEIWLNNKYVD
jgi:hypothetical protein